MLHKSRKVKLIWRRNLSSYAETNKKVLVDDIRKIGSSITAVNKMVSSGEEMRTYLKSMIGVSPTSSDWDKAVNHYWNSLSVPIPAYEKELEIGFVYDITDPEIAKTVKAINDGLPEKDRLKTDADLANFIQARLDRVIEDYKQKVLDAAKLPDENSRSKALNMLYNTKWEQTISIESDHYKVGRPINLEHYLLWRYCLAYRDVANEMSAVEKSPAIRFYLHSEAEAKAEKERKNAIEKNRMAAFLKISSDAAKVDNILYAAGMGEEVKAFDEVDKVLKLQQFSETNSAKFVALSEDPNLSKKAKIEKYIVHGILRRLPNTEIVVDASDPSVIVGNNVSECISFFADSTNKAVVSEYEAKFKGLLKVKTVDE